MPRCGLQCADCHFARTRTATASSMARSPTRSRSAAATATARRARFANLRTSGPAAPPSGTNLELIRNEDGRRRFEWMDCELARGVPTCSARDRRADPALDRRSEPGMGGQPGPRQHRRQPAALRRARRQATPGPCFNMRSARAKLMSRDGRGDRPLRVRHRACRESQLAHPDNEMACFTCHLSWTTSCAGCHLPIEANFRTTHPPL